MVRIIKVVIILIALPVFASSQPGKEVKANFTPALKYKKFNAPITYSLEKNALDYSLIHQRAFQDREKLSDLDFIDRELDSMDSLQKSIDVDFNKEYITIGNDSLFNDTGELLHKDSILSILDESQDADSSLFDSKSDEQIFEWGDENGFEDLDLKAEINITGEDEENVLGVDSLTQTSQIVEKDSLEIESNNSIVLISDSLEGNDSNAPTIINIHSSNHKKERADSLMILSEVKKVDFEEPIEKSKESNQNPINVETVRQRGDSVIFDNRYLLKEPVSESTILESKERIRTGKYKDLTEREATIQTIKDAELERELARKRFELEKEQLENERLNKESETVNQSSNEPILEVVEPKPVMPPDINLVIAKDLEKSTSISDSEIDSTHVFVLKEQQVIERIIFDSTAHSNYSNLTNLYSLNRKKDSLSNSLYQEKVTERFNIIERKLDTLINALGKTTIVDRAKVTAVGVEHEVYFSLNSSKISQSQLQLLKARLNDVERTENMRLILSGFTDSSGDSEYNLMLSKKRSEAVQNALYQLGFQKAQILLESYGETRSSNNFNANDRKVVIALIKNN